MTSGSWYLELTKVYKVYKMYVYLLRRDGV